MWRFMRSGIAILLVTSALTSALPAQNRRQVARPTAQPVVTPTTTGATLSLIQPGPAPVGIAVIGTPASATVSWQAAPNAVRYTVGRYLKDNPSCCAHSADNITATTWTDNTGGLQWSGVYVYTVTAIYADGSAGAAQFEWTRPEPANPTALTATQKAEGVVELAWPAVAGASYYLLWGPGLADATRAMGTSHTVANVSAGTHQYMIGAYFEPGPVSTPAAMFTKGSVKVTSMTGTYRVTINGFSVNHATAEDPGNWDGVSDEVYATAFVQIFDRGNKSLVMQPSVVQTVEHGDVSKWRGRVRAGAMTAAGGIGPGDRVPDNTNPAAGPTGQPTTTSFPLLVFHGPLTQGKEVVVIRPVLWESDGNRNAYDMWHSHFTESAPEATYNFIEGEIAKPGIQIALGEFMLSANCCSKFIDLGSFRITRGTDRPIGLAPRDRRLSYLEWQDRLVVLTKEKLDSIFDSPYSTTTVGIIPIPLADQDAGDIPYSGNYVLYLRVERLP